MPLQHQLKNWIFSKLHQSKLIYNTCWEDPRCDRLLLDIQKNSKILMITSAGCNALDYLLDHPAEIQCVDMNYRQNALLELKKSGLRNLNHSVFFDLFGKGFSEQAISIYHEILRQDLSDLSKGYWDKYIRYFSGRGPRKSFYYRGTSGFLAYSVTHLLRVKKQIRSNLTYLFNAVDLEEQQQYFAAVEQMVFNRYVKLLVNNHYTMTLAGVPQNQQVLINQSYEEGILEYIRDCFKKIFTTLDVSENYFYQVYYNGSYTSQCCPEYLKQENFNTLGKQLHKVKTKTTTISQFLKDQPGQYSHFVLLDHQDWLASNDPKALEEEWELILENSIPGTKILMRSAAKEIDFFPEFVKKKVYFNDEKTKAIHQLDRVGTYASVYLGIVQ